MGQDGSGRPEKIPCGAERAAQGTRRARRMVRRAQAQLRGIVGAGQNRLREKLRGAEEILRQGEEGVLAREQIRLRAGIGRCEPCGRDSSFFRCSCWRSPRRTLRRKWGVGAGAGVSARIVPPKPKKNRRTASISSR